MRRTAGDKRRSFVHLGLLLSAAPHVPGACAAMAADGAMGQPGVQVPRSTLALMRLHDGYSTRLHSATEDLLEHYAAMVKASHLTV